MPEPVLVAVALAAALVAGSVPFSQLTARATAGTDLRRVGTGTVSGTGLWRVAGFGPLVVGGLLDVGKGVVGPLLAGNRPWLAAGTVALTVVGHNWSLFLKGAGGRGISPALGGLGVVAWPASVVLLAGLGLGRVVRQTGLGSFLAQVGLVPVAGLTAGWPGAAAGLGVVVPLWIKRATGDRLPPPGGWRRALPSRVLFDREPAPRDRVEPGESGSERTHE
jgi:glycerol-3-phosphate acyltransferase PlsY